MFSVVSLVRCEILLPAIRELVTVQVVTCTRVQTSGTSGKKKVYKMSG